LQRVLSGDLPPDDGVAHDADAVGVVIDFDDA